MWFFEGIFSDSNLRNIYEKDTKLRPRTIGSLNFFFFMLKDTELKDLIQLDVSIRLFKIINDYRKIVSCLKLIVLSQRLVILFIRIKFMDWTVNLIFLNNVKVIGSRKWP